MYGKYTYKIQFLIEKTISNLQSSKLVQLTPLSKFTQDSYYLLHLHDSKHINAGVTLFATS